MTGRIIALVGLALAPFGIEAQNAATAPSFEVASIRLSKPGTRGGSMEFPPGGQRFVAENMPFGALVLMAYDITVRQLSGPGAVLSEHYDVAAKAEHSVRPDEMRRMLQALLRERFRLALRRETREVPVFALTVGRSGIKLHASESGERDSPRTPSRANGAEQGSGHVIFRNESMPDFAWALTRMAGIGISRGRSPARPR
ncbi:MAG TPA: TIGR03435 family protein, partial [Bryobacteraceae bacterium]|nr:TIGR03435 family protein [Bryobacteraceae bacterium]